MGMERYRGKGVCGAAAVGEIWLFRLRETSVKRRHVGDTEAEKARVAEARERAVGQLKEVYGKTLREAGEANARIFEAHMLLLEDEGYNSSILNMIDTEQVNAEYAVVEASARCVSMFEAMEDPYMRARAADIRDISDRLIRSLSAETEERDSPDRMIVCADDLTPSETAILDRGKVLAFVTARGSLNSHTAILARTLNIPAVVGVGDDFLARVENGMTAIVDGFRGEVFLDPDRETLARYEREQAEALEKRKLLLGLRGMDNVTLDGVRIRIYANIEGVDGVGAALLNDAGGIGLFRSEFLYLESADYPTEEQQFAVYKKVLEGMGGRRVVIRTLDIGADKQAEYFRLERETNPALGLRGIRLCLARPEIFRTQLRALYRASVYGNLGIMFPMITSVSELERIREICGEVRAELEGEGAACSDNVELGIMIETPAAAVISDRLAPMADFFSVGTNDLTQYTLACDRQNRMLDDLCDTRHEAVLRLIELTAENAHKNGKWVGICGELAADLTLTETFLRMGIDELSVPPDLVLAVRNRVRGLNLTLS